MYSKISFIFHFLKGIEREGAFATSALLKQVTVKVLDSKLCNSNHVTSICAGKISPVVHDSCQVTYIFISLLEKYCYC